MCVYYIVFIYAVRCYDAGLRINAQEKATRTAIIHKRAAFSRSHKAPGHINSVNCSHGDAPNRINARRVEPGHLLTLDHAFLQKVPARCYQFVEILFLGTTNRSEVNKLYSFAHAGQHFFLHKDGMIADKCLVLLEVRLFFNHKCVPVE